jgi:molybdopterin synthase catalytic subunit
MANSLCEVLLTEAPLAPPAGSGEAFAGAIVNFWGVVRKLEGGREIEGIDYEAHAAMAAHQLRSVANEAVSKFGVGHVIIHHRIGFVGTGEASLFLQVKAKHRQAAFGASEWMIDELKRKVPIWKHPKFKIAPPSPRLRRGRPAAPRLRRGKQREQETLLRK